MAVGTPTQGTVLSQGSGTSANVPFPSVVNNHDRLVLLMSASTTTAITTPAGWSIPANSPVVGTSSFGQIAVFHKEADGTEGGTTLTVTRPSSGMAAIILAFPGVDTTNPIDVTPTVINTNTASGSSILPSQTITRTGAALVCLSVLNGTTQTATPPTGFTEVMDDHGTGSGAPKPTEASYQTGVAAGATGTETVTWTASAKNGGILIALRPAATANTGDASPALTVGTSSAGHLGRSGAATPTVTISVSSAVILGVHGTATPTLTVATSSTGTRGKIGGATPALTVTATSAGVVTTGKVGAAAPVITIAATSAARLGLAGVATPVLTVGAASAGARGKVGTATPTLTIGAVSAGTTDTGPAAVQVLTVSVDAAGFVTRMPQTLIDYGYGGRRRNGTGMVTYDPPVVPVPSTVPQRAQWIVARVIHSATGVGAARVYDRQDERKDRAPHRILVGGVDVTYFRGAETPEPTWDLIAPGGYGPGRIQFPQIQTDEELGAGDLAWVTPWAEVVVQRLDGSHTVSYRGLLSDFDLDGPTFASTLAGELTGLAAAQYRPPPLFRRTHDISTMVLNMIRDRLRLNADGPLTGIEITATGGQSELDWMNEMMALSQLKDGTQFTVMPGTTDRAYHLQQKDLATIDWTLYLDDADTVPHLRRDFMAEPNREYAQAVRDDGLNIRFATYPGLQFKDRPPFPGTLSSGSSGAGVLTLVWRLRVLGFLAFGTGVTYDDDVVDGVRRAQRMAGLLDSGAATPGVVNAATWEALWNINYTGASLRQARIRPAAQLKTTYKFITNDSGQVLGLNPFYDPTVVKVDQMTDMGSGRTRKQVENWAERELHDGQTPNYVGTIDITMGGVIIGEHNPGDAFSPSMIEDARAVQPGHNLWLPNFQGGNLVHITGASKSDTGVTLTVDTRARDTMKVWEIIDRNQEARRDPARNFLNNTLRSHHTNDTTTPWDDVGGFVPDLITIPANTWTVFPVVAGQEGQIRDFDITTTPPSEYCIAVFGRDIDPGRLQQLVPAPLTDDGRRDWRRKHQQLTENHFLLYAAGVMDNPCGYYPSTKAEVAADFPVLPTYLWLTGRFKDEAGFPYFCDQEPVVRVAVYADRDTTIEPARIFRVQLDDAAG